jgi:hypothetical protein
MKYICLYKHPQLPLCRVSQAKTHNDLKDWVCIKAYRYDDDATPILRAFSSLHESKAENIYNIKPQKFVDLFDEFIEANKPKKRPPALRAIAFILAMAILATHVALRVMLIPVTICLFILMGGSLHATAMVAVLYRCCNLTKLMNLALAYTTERSAK